MCSCSYNDNAGIKARKKRQYKRQLLTANSEKSGISLVRNIATSWCSTEKKCDRLFDCYCDRLKKSNKKGCLVEIVPFIQKSTL